MFRDTAAGVVVRFLNDILDEVLVVGLGLVPGHDLGDAAVAEDVRLGVALRVVPHVPVGIHGGGAYQNLFENEGGEGRERGEGRGEGRGERGERRRD